MKVLVAVPVDKPTHLSKGCLTWASRAGFQVRMFSPELSKRRLSRFHAAIDHVNYEEYLDVKYSMLLPGNSALKYAQEGKYDILVILPPSLKAWNDTVNDSLMVIEFQADVAEVRRKMAKDPQLMDMTYPNGARIVRVW